MTFPHGHYFVKINQLQCTSFTSSPQCDKLQNFAPYNNGTTGAHVDSPFFIYLDYSVTRGDTTLSFPFFSSKNTKWLFEFSCNEVRIMKVI